MVARELLLAVGIGALVMGCTEPPAAMPSDDTREIVDNLLQAGFPRDDIQVVGPTVYVGRDAEVSLAASREMLQRGGSSEEQYRTTNLVGASLIKICVNGSAFTGLFSTALDLAIQNYNEQPLRFFMARIPATGVTGCGATITAVIQTGVDGGVSGFPSGGVPFSTINIGDLTASHGVNTLAHVITHELGHTIGFRHSDYFNRSISCGGAPTNEGDAGIGAILIPGTPSGATVGGSLMNSCFRPSETGDFSSTDVTALRALYGLAVGALDFNVAFQANTGFLWIIGPSAPVATSLAVATGTSPSIARLTTGGYEVAFQGSNGHLWLTGIGGTSDTGFAMRAPTSPSITALTTGGYQVAFQASNSILWTTGTAGTGSLGFGMATTTSPAIAGLNGGTYTVAFQANTGELWTAGAGGSGSTGFAMAAGTSPAIAGLVTGGFEVVYQASNTVIGVTGTASTTSLGFGAAPGTSPSIAGLSTGGFEVAWQAAGSSQLWIYGATGTGSLGFGMAPGTSPSIAARPGGGYDLTFQANTGMLWSVGATGTGNLNFGLAGGTGPAAN